MGKRVAEHKAGLAVLLAVVSAPALLAGAPKEVVATWEELPPLVEKRDIETVLLNGVHIRGRVERVLPEALEVRVKRTSDPGVVPKRRTWISRKLVNLLRMERKRLLARILLPAGMFFAGPILFSDPVVENSEGAYYAIALGSAAAGYVLGSALDSVWVDIRIVPSVQSTASDGKLAPSE